MSGRVFVVQRPAYYDRERRGWVNKYDLSPAERYGRLEFILRPGNIFRDRLDESVDVIRQKLQGFNPDEDHVLAVGDPVAIAATVMVASSMTGGRVSVLKYDRQENDYLPFAIRAQNDG